MRLTTRCRRTPWPRGNQTPISATAFRKTNVSPRFSIRKPSLTLSICSGSFAMWMLSSTACLARIRRARNPLRVQLGNVDILPGLKSGDSYGLHAYAWIPSVGSCHDALTACEGCEQASEANPASRIFTALMKSALADSPHWTHSNLACVLRLSADTRPHPPKDTEQVRLVFCGGTGYNRPPLHSVLYSS